PGRGLCCLRPEVAGRRRIVTDADRGPGPSDRTPLRLAQTHPHGPAAAGEPVAAGLAGHRAGAAVQGPRRRVGRAGVLGHRRVLRRRPADAVTGRWRALSPPAGSPVPSAVGGVTFAGGPAARASVVAHPLASRLVLDPVATQTKEQVLKLSTALLRAVPGAFILNSGIGKLGMDEETAAGLQQMAANGVPMVENLTASQFGKFLSYGEIAVGSALLLPFVPTRIAGAALTTFAAGLVSNYFSIDSMTKDDGIRPSEDGIPVAKDTWLAAIGLALVLS